jgi:transposase InsO family protein
MVGLKPILQINSFKSVESIRGHTTGYGRVNSAPEYRRSWPGLHGCPEIFNTDQGVQFTSYVFTSHLERAGIAISMDGRGRALDNIFVERLWRTVKYEDIYLKDYATVPALEAGLARYFTFYNCERPHQSLGYRTPAEVHRKQ